MRNKLIIEKEKDFINYLKYKHNSMTEIIKQLNDEKLDLETKLVENLICPECYSLLKEEKHKDYINYDCTNCWYDTLHTSKN